MHRKKSARRFRLLSSFFGLLLISNAFLPNIAEAHHLTVVKNAIVQFVLNVRSGVFGSVAHVANVFGGKIDLGAAVKALPKTSLHYSLLPSVPGAFAFATYRGFDKLALATPSAAKPSAGISQGSPIIIQNLNSISPAYVSALVNVRFNSLSQALRNEFKTLSQNTDVQVATHTETLPSQAEYEGLRMAIRFLGLPQTLTTPTISGGSINSATISGATATGGSFAPVTLSVSGSATSTFGGGIDLASGCIAISGTCVAGSGLGTVSSGSANALAYYTSGTTVDDAGLLFWDNSSSRLGIGTTSPYSMLSVAGQVVGQNFVATSTTATSTFAGPVAFSETTGLITLGKAGSAAVDYITINTGSATNPSFTDPGTSGAITGRGITFQSYATGSYGDLRIADFNSARTTDYASYIRLGGSSGEDLLISPGRTSLGDAGILHLGVDGLSNGPVIVGGGSLPTGGSSTTVRFLVGSISGTSRFIVTDAGNTGVGTSSPWARLSVSATSSVSNNITPLFVVASTTSSSSSGMQTAFLIDQNGLVGIGTTTPYAQLSVAGLAAASNLNADNASATSTFKGGLSVAGASGLTVLQNSLVGIGTTSPTTFLDISANGAGGIAVTTFRTAILGGAITLTHARGTQTSPSALSVGDAAGNLYFKGRQSDNTDQIVGNIQAKYNGDNKGLLQFLVNNTPDEVMRLGNSVNTDSSSNAISGLGIGISTVTTTPETQLDVRGSVTKATTINFQNILNLASRDATGFLTLRAGIKADATAANRYGGIEVDDAGTKRPLVLQSAGGNVGVGTTSPFAILSVSGAAGGTTPLFAVSSSTSVFATSTAFIIDSAGKVGIGTSTPSSMITMIGGDSTHLAEIEIHNNFAVGEKLYTHDDSGFRGPVIQFHKSRGTQANQTAVQAGDTLGYVNWYGYNSSAYAAGASIRALPTETWTTTSNGTYIEFDTMLTGASGSVNERMRIDGNGNLGVGTSTPWGRLSVSATSSVANNNTPLFVVASTTNSGATGNQTAFIIDKNGNVGIGTTSITSTLTIQGSLCVIASSSTGCTLTPGNISASKITINQADLAENYPAEDPTLEAGDIVSLAVASPVSNHLTPIKKAEKNDAHILGVVSTKPGLTLGEDLEGQYIRTVALAGRVPVKVSLDQGSIRAGDYIALSPVSGVGAKALVTGEVLGIALEPYSGGTPASILVFIQPGYQVIGATESSSFVQVIQNTLAQASDWVGEKITSTVGYFKNLVVGSSDAPSGITIFDKVTSEAYCLEIVNGAPVATKGKCGEGHADNTNAQEATTTTTTTSLDPSESTSATSTEPSITTPLSATTGTTTEN